MENTERQNTKFSLLPTDNEVETWFVDNIGEGCSASSGIYKFRLWLEDRRKQLTDISENG